MLNSKLIWFTHPNKHTVIKPNAFQYISMLYSSADNSCIFHKTTFPSKNNTIFKKKKTQWNSFEREENTVFLFLAIIILHD